MISSSFVRGVLALPLATVAGCTTHPQEQHGYSPNYSYIATDDGRGSGKAVNASVLAPDACLAEPADTAPSDTATAHTIVPELGPHLPPGCANAYNLQRMVESERELVEGRPMGPAAAAPSVRAARKYLDGEDGQATDAPSASEETLAP